MFISDWHMQSQTLFSLALKLFWKNPFKLKMEQEAEFALKQRWPKNNIKYGSVDLNDAFGHFSAFMEKVTKIAIFLPWMIWFVY